MELWELVAREEVRRTLGDYVHAGDRGRADDLGALFTADGTLVSGTGPPVTGPQGVADHIRASAATTATAAAGDGPRLVRHHVTSTRITEISPDRAVAHSYFLVATDRGVDHWGRYRDLLVPSGDRWRFARREVTVDGAVDGGWYTRRRAADT